jgi:hypothetical protein
MERNRNCSISRAVFLLPALSLLLFQDVPAFAGVPPEPPGGIESDDARSRAAELIGYYHSIALSPEEEMVWKEALSSIRAPCCSDFSMATCCCPCNLAKSVWGLAKQLIRTRGYDSAQVKKAVLDWLRFANPNGYSGKACFTAGGCIRSFDKDGCGGMDDKKIS